MVPDSQGPTKNAPMAGESIGVTYSVDCSLLPKAGDPSQDCSEDCAVPENPRAETLLAPAVAEKETPMPDVDKDRRDALRRHAAQQFEVAAKSGLLENALTLATGQDSYHKSPLQDHGAAGPVCSPPSPKAPAPESAAEATSTNADGSPPQKSESDPSAFPESGPVSPPDSLPSQQCVEADCEGVMTASPSKMLRRDVA